MIQRRRGLNWLAAAGLPVLDERCQKGLDLEQGRAVPDGAINTKRYLQSGFIQTFQAWCGNILPHG